MSIKINEKVIELDKDGFLIDSDQWEPAVAEAMVSVLSEDEGVKEQLSALFFGSPANTACRYAGLTKPVSSACV